MVRQKDFWDHLGEALKPDPQHFYKTMLKYIFLAFTVLILVAILVGILWLLSVPV